MARGDDSSFLDLFRRFLERTDTRLTEIEKSQAALQQEVASLKDDRCAKHELEIQELFKSRNEMAKTMEQIKGTATGLTKICESLDSTVASLDKKALLLGAGEKGVLQQLKEIAELDIPTRLKSLEDKAAEVEQTRKESKANTKDYRMLIAGAILAAVFSTISGVLVYYLTT